MLQRRSQRTRDGRALLLAGALHGAVVIALWGWAEQHTRPHPQISPLAPTNWQHPVADEFELDLDWLPGRAPLSVGNGRQVPTPTRSLASAAPQRTSPIARLPPPAVDVEQVGQVASAESSLPTPPQSSAPPSRAIDLGLGPADWRRWLSETKSEVTRGERAQATSRALFRAPPVSTSGGLQEGLEAQDRALGLGTSGSVVSALYHAAHGDVAPFEGVARFRVTVLKTGEVEITLTDATGDLAGWSAVAVNAAEALRRAPPHIPNARKGARLVVEITAKQVFPNGVRLKDLHGLRTQVEPLRFHSVSSAQRELTDRNPVSAERAAPGQSATGSKANVNLPGFYLGARGKVCGYRLGLTPFGPLFNGGCDLSNLGAKPQRLVSTLVRDETLY